MSRRTTTELPEPEGLVALLQQKHKETGLSLASMARAAGLHPNSFNRLYDKSWRPRLDTLRKIRDWLSTGRPSRPDMLSELPLEGEGWRIIHDQHGWWVCTDGEAVGPFAALRNAVGEARTMEPGLQQAPSPAA